MKILLDGRDITQQATPLERSRTILVDVAALSSSLGLRVQNADGHISIVDTSGTEWKARSGSLFLEAGSCRLTFVVPMLQQGSALYLPLETAAELAGASLDLDPAGHKACLTLRHEESVPAEDFGQREDTVQPPARRPKVIGTPLSDWQNFTLEKPEGEQDDAAGSQNTNRLSGSSLLRLPNSKDFLTFGLGFGFLQGSGLGTQLTIEGRYLGANVRFASMLTANAQGRPLQNTQLQWADPETGKSIALGSFYSDLWGSGLGARYGWQAGKNHQPALSLYLAGPNSPVSRPVLALQDTFHLAKGAWLGGEIGTDGSQYLQGRIQTPRLSGTAYYRHLSAGFGGGHGASFAYDLGRGFGLYAEINSGTSQYDSSDFRNFSLRVPLTRLIDLTLEDTYARTNANSGHAYAATLSLPLGPLRFFARYQGRQSAALGLAANTPLGSQYSQLMQTSVTYLANSRLRLELHSYASGLQGSLHSEREEFTTNYRLSNRTQFQVTTLFPSASAPMQSRLHLEHQINNSLAMTVEYGLPSFSAGNLSDGGWQGLTCMLHTHWATPTPTRGGTVKGQVTDMAGVTIPGVWVHLNHYQTQTDARGYYAFTNIPAGTYDLNLIESSLPADAKVAQSDLHLTLDSRSRKEIPLHILPLHTIAGHVYYDTEENSKENSKTDNAKALDGIAVSIDGLVTTTGKDGSFAFYNLELGPHTIRLLTERLPEDLVLVSPAEVVTVLTLDHSVSGIVFRVKKHEKETLFQDVK